MCLSTVYKIDNNGNKEELAQDIASVSYINGKLVFSDIMGVQTETEGQISEVNLMDNYIIVK